MLYHEKLSIVLLIIILVKTEGFRHKKNWYYIHKRSKSQIQKENWPLLVTIREEYPTNRCVFSAGSLIRKNWVLTSAMVCGGIYPSRKEKYIVKSYLLEKACGVDKSAKMYSKARFVHPEFHYRQFFTVGIGFNDVALLKLEAELPNCQVQKLRLPTWPAKTGTSCKTVAWDKQFNGNMYEEQETVISKDECRKTLRESYGMSHITIGDMHFCTKSKETRSGVMVLGQPLMCDNVQYGIANMPNFQPNYSIWTRTDRFIDWINEIIPENDDETMDAVYSNDYG